MLSILHSKIRQLQEWLSLHSDEIKIAAKSQSRVGLLYVELKNEYRHKLSTVDNFIEFMLNNMLKKDKNTPPLQISLHSLENIRRRILEMYRDYENVASMLQLHLVKIREIVRKIKVDEKSGKYQYQGQYQRHHNKQYGRHQRSYEKYSRNMHLREDSYKNKQGKNQYVYLYSNKDTPKNKQIQKNVQSTKDSKQKYIKSSQKQYLFERKKLFAQPQILINEFDLLQSKIQHKSQNSSQDSLKDLPNEIYQIQNNDDSLEKIKSENNETAKFQNILTDSTFSKEFSFGM